MPSSALIGRDAMQLKALPLLCMALHVPYARRFAGLSQKILRRSLYPPAAFSPRSLTPLEARGALFDEGPDTFPGVLRFTADVLREGFKFESSTQIDVLVVVQGTLGQA